MVGLAIAIRFLWGWRNRILIVRARELEALVAERTAQLRQANRDLAEMATHDALTGIANYRCFEEFFQREWRVALREQSPLSILMVDVDSFKAYNDLYGHQAGDHCLKQVSDEMAAVIGRPGDLVARYGGDEFIAVLARTDRQAALGLARKLRQRVKALAIPHLGSFSGARVSVSVGLYSDIPRGQVEPAAFVRAADNALYRAKQRRDCVRQTLSLPEEAAG